MMSFQHVSWSALLPGPLGEQVHRQWVMRFRMPAVDFLTDEFDATYVADMMNNNREDFEMLVAALIAGVLRCQ